MNTKRVVLVDDNEMFRITLRKFLQEEYQYKIVGEASSGKELFELSNYCTADVILMDLQMPQMDGFVTVKKLLTECHTVPVIAVTMSIEKAYLQELISVGFRGCVFKSEVFKNIHNAIVQVINNGYFFPKEIKI